MQAETNLKVASRWDRARYGEQRPMDSPALVNPDANLMHGMVELLKLAASGKLQPLPERVVESVEIIDNDAPRA